MKKQSNEEKIIEERRASAQKSVSLFKAKYGYKKADKYHHPVKMPDLMPGVVPSSATSGIAMDSTSNVCYAQFQGFSQTQGFPGYPYLANLTTKPEYRAFADALSTEITREWIELTSSESSGEGTSEKMKVLDEELKRLGLRDLIKKCIAQDVFFGRAQIFIKLKDQKEELPLVLKPETVPLGSLDRLAAVEAVWTTPVTYNSIDPSAPDFYTPTKWFMLGKEVHASRLLTVITRPVSDMLKPAFNFGGISMSQLAEPYVDNWLRTRQSVSDLINNFSVLCLATSMDQVLQGGEGPGGDGTDLLARIELFTEFKSNRGLMLLDKEREEMSQIAVPLGGLHELQSQSQEHMCSVSHTPAIKLTGISPSGLNASSDTEMESWYDWVAGQSDYWRGPIETIIKVAQLSLFGEIDKDIDFKFVSLKQVNPVEESQVRLNDASASTQYIAAGVIDPSEERKRLAEDEDSGYQGIDVDATPYTPPDTKPEGETDPVEDEALDSEFKESEHTRSGNGQFGSGSSSAAASPKKASSTKEEEFKKADKKRKKKDKNMFTEMKMMFRK